MGVRGRRQLGGTMKLTNLQEVAVKAMMEAACQRILGEPLLGAHGSAGKIGYFAGGRVGGVKVRPPDYGEFVIPLSREARR